MLVLEHRKPNIKTHYKCTCTCGCVFLCDREEMNFVFGISRMTCPECRRMVAFDYKKLDEEDCKEILEEYEAFFNSGKLKNDCKEGEENADETT